jgi:hypothetical protein
MGRYFWSAIPTVAVITEAGNNPKVLGMVYVAAFAPEEGETLGGMAAKYPTPPAYSEFRQVDDGYLVTEKGVRENFAPDLSSAEQSLVFAVQGATQGAILGTPIKSCLALQTQLVCHRFQRSHDRTRTGDQHCQKNGREDFDRSQQSSGNACATRSGRSFRDRRRRFPRGKRSSLSDRS